MNDPLAVSSDTKATLLLTAPLIIGRSGESPELLSLGEFNRLVEFLAGIHRSPADLIGPESSELAEECREAVDPDRLTRLASRGLLLSQAMERWHSRSIWVVSRLDDSYPPRLLDRLGAKAPPILYGCGDRSILETAGLAIVGSRNADTDLLDYTMAVGRLASQAGHAVVSGGARGVDQAAMRGALEVDGKVIGILADSLDRAAIAREHREPFIEGRLVVISPYDPLAGFSAGNAMQRNKLIYAMADAALVVGSDFQKGGTWSGAVEQLEKLRLVPVFVRTLGEASPGLDGLRRKGAMPWPEPETPDEFRRILSEKVAVTEAPVQQGFSFSFRERPDPSYEP